MYHTPGADFWVKKYADNADCVDGGGVGGGWGVCCISVIYFRKTLLSLILQILFMNLYSLLLSENLISPLKYQTSIVKSLK